MRDKRSKGGGTWVNGWGGENKEAELGVTGQGGVSPLREAATSLLATTWGGHKWVLT